MERNNLIPKIGPSYSKWKLYYKNYLDNLYDIFENHIKDWVPLDANDEEIYEEFCTFIFSVSSKYISPYL
jgi:hypothetical protein